MPHGLWCVRGRLNPTTKTRTRNCPAHYGSKLVADYAVNSRNSSNIVLIERRLGTNQSQGPTCPAPLIFPSNPIEHAPEESAIWWVTVCCGGSSMRVRIYLCFVLVLAASDLGRAQQSVTSATLSGRIEDERGAFVSGANIIATHVETNQQLTTTSDEE